LPAGMDAVNAPEASLPMTLLLDAKAVGVFPSNSEVSLDRRQQILL